jgi:hypothetical protein
MSVRVTERLATLPLTLPLRRKRKRLAGASGERGKGAPQGLLSPFTVSGGVRGLGDWPRAARARAPRRSFLHAQ